MRLVIGWSARRCILMALVVSAFSPVNPVTAAPRAAAADQGQAADPAAARAARAAEEAAHRERQQEGLDAHQFDNWELAGNWNWGDLFYGNTYHGALHVKNSCANYEVAEIYISSALQPYLTSPKRVIVTPHTNRRVDMTVTTPDAPPRAGEKPGRGWVLNEKGKFDYLLVEGKVRINQRESRTDPDQNCIGVEKDYLVSGHIHQNPGQNLDLCLHYWISGELPDDVDCDAEFRKLATHYISSTLAPSVGAAPSDWSWLPSQAEIGGMSDDQLLAMKLRAEQQRLAQ